jgi:hypothetical protein
MDGWITISRCSFCDSSKLMPYKAVYSAPYLQIEFCNGAFPVLTPSTYIVCNDCGLVMQSPRMTDERIRYYYSSGTYRGSLGMTVEAMDADEKKRSDEVAAWLLSRGVTPKSHLDVGSSRGYLLENMGAAIAHGLDEMNYSTAHMITRDAQAQVYDLVTSVHCLEHTTDPLKELQYYKSMSSDKVYIEVPGEKCTGGPLRFAHLYYFPPETLFSMIERCGLRILEMDTKVNTKVLCSVLD